MRTAASCGRRWTRWRSATTCCCARASRRLRRRRVRMNLIRDLDVSTPRLRRSAFLIGGVLVVLALAFRSVFSGVCGVVLIALGALAPASLRAPYRVWMTFALALGWVVSRAVLALLFGLVVTPIAVVARLSGKRFLDLRPDPSATTYWIPRGNNRPRYDKMY